MITGRDFIIISSIEWNFIWQGHQEIALRLAQAGNRVLYIENTGIRRPGIGDLGRIKGRLRRWAGALLTAGEREVAPGVHVCSPVVLPPFGAPWQRMLNRRLLLPQIARVVKRLRFKQAIVWTYLPTDTAADIVQLLGPQRALTVYYCGADFTQLVQNEAQLRSCESALVRDCDVVLTNCDALSSRFRALRTDLHKITFGVDMTAFPELADPNLAVEAELERELGHLRDPVIGYVGGLHKHIDYELLRASARARPDWTWLLIGPVQTGLAGLEAVPNVRLLGQKEHAALAHYIRRCDVCIIPYLMNGFTATVVPVKLNEYLAMGKRVVSTRLPEVCAFNDEHNVVALANSDCVGFVGAIESALRTEVDVAEFARRRAVAAKHDWSIQMELISDAIEQVEGVIGSAELQPD